MSIEPGIFATSNANETQTMRLFYMLSLRNKFKSNQTLRKKDENLHISSDIESARAERRYDNRSYFADDHSMEDVCKVFDDNGLDVGVMEQRTALVRSSNTHICAMQCCGWKTISFSLSLSLIQNKFTSISLIKNLSAPANKLSEGQLKELWCSLYDFVKIRKSKRISGKCWA